MKLLIPFLACIIQVCAHGDAGQAGEIYKLVLEELHGIKQSQTECDARLTSLEQTVEELKRDKADLQEEIRTLKAYESNRTHHVASPSGIQKRQAMEQVAFTVGVSESDLTHLGNHQTIIFRRAISNAGNAFHTQSGIFLAPLRGLYCFTLTIMVRPQKAIYLEIVMDGNPVNDIYATSPNAGDYESTTKQWILEVNKGSEVWIRAKGTDTEIHGGMHTLLSGFLLFQTE